MAQQQRNKFVIHTYETPDGTPLRVNLGDRWYDLPTGEPVEIDDGEFYAEKLIENYGPVYGIVECMTTRGRTGISIDIEAACAHANRELERVENNLLNHWVMQQQQDRVKMNMPVLPPTGRVEEIIRKRGVDLKAAYNLTPVGFDYTPGPAKASGREAELEAENARLKAQIADDAAKTEERLAKLEALIA